jgi:hypothetical protein
VEQIAGIQIDKNAKGIATHIRFDLKKFGATLKPILDSLDVNDFVEDSFEKDWQNGITGNQLRAEVFEHLKTLPWKK